MERTYRTVQGDMWDMIAQKTLGGHEHTGTLMMANRQYLNYYIFPEGITLDLPLIAQEANSALLPWR